MTASIIDGKMVAAIHLAQLKEQVSIRTAQGHVVPGLAVILMGSEPASTIYVRNKRKACLDVGIMSHAYDLPTTTSQDELIQLIDGLNTNNSIHGILIQLPLPTHIDESIILERIKPEKDVDGFHPYNLGRLAQRNPRLRPCTPKGIMSLLNYYQLDVKGKHAVVIGASNIVGRPMSLELLLAGATVTICHRFTQNLQSQVLPADFIIVATGIIDVIQSSWLKKHQVVIDVGMHRLADGSIRGDVDFKKARETVAWITPVPGGVGPMTIVSLLENTLLAAGV
jgi:methylenetetrahydrofolate dehydrogenase (NADP+) / methenyltetrahydrofolate cyclohydrolase